MEHFIHLHLHIQEVIVHSSTMMQRNEEGQISNIKRTTELNLNIKMNISCIQ